MNIEENQKLYKHMERGESHLRYQRLSAPVPSHVQSDGLVCGIAVRGDSFGELPPFYMIDGAFLQNILESPSLLLGSYRKRPLTEKSHLDF